MSGMDTATSGEIFIAGKSANDFKPADFDLYRNTYVGFVFQDFSLIDSLTVAENIKMSLKLQGKIVTDAEVEDALAKVGLDKVFINRNPQELSGGQRQRIAIARALIKNPKIVFADEPTGSLDAETSKQVLGMLKELSKDRLVIIVSHDIDSALLYGDRIITLKDGKVIDDKTKKYQPDLAGFKKEYQAKIDEAFTKTKEDKTERINNFARTDTRLPFREALKIATDNFRRKKLNFAITLFLTIVALSIFSVSSIMQSYSAHNAELRTFNKLGIQTLLVNNTVEKAEEDLTPADIIKGDTRDIIVFDDITADAVEQKIGDKIMPAYRLGEIRIPGVNEIISSNNGILYRSRSNEVYQNLINSLVEYNGDLGDFYGVELLMGRTPRHSDNAIEIIIPNYIADGIMNKGGQFYGGVVVYPNTGYENILNTVLEFNNLAFKIVGIFSTDYTEVMADKIADPTIRKLNFRASFNMANVYTAALCQKGEIYNYLNNLIDNFTAETMPNIFKGYDEDTGDEIELTDEQRIAKIMVVANYYVPLSSDSNSNTMLNYFDDNNLWYSTYASAELKAFNNLFAMLGDILDWVSLVMFFFVIILIYNFISSGIKSKTHEIGILRALGAKGTDIAKIFAIEGFAIWVLQTVMSVVLIFLAVAGLNLALTQQFVTPLSVLVVTPLSLLFVAIIGITVVAAASILPLVRLTKMRPADVMRARE
jgi:ABC-type lipoprotein export system ATPase subunit/ABC-type antimicrobial peptide transport system permease subunit